MLRPAIACLLAAAGVVQAQAESFELDPVHTRVAFLVDHAGFSRAIGTFSGATGALHFDPDDWSTARLDVTLPLATLDIGVPRPDNSHCALKLTAERPLCRRTPESPTAL